jgi:hypothetical protein
MVRGAALASLVLYEKPLGFPIGIYVSSRFDVDAVERDAYRHLIVLYFKS